MRQAAVRKTGFILWLAIFSLWAASAQADGDLSKVNHIIIVMQENHSFDNYFGVLPNAAPLTSAVPGPYHNNQGNGPCPTSDHTCVDSLNCTRDAVGNYTCTNFNVENDGSSPVFVFHDRNYCPAPDLDHSWPSSHLEANFSQPELTFGPSPNDGFVQVNDMS